MFDDHMHTCFSGDSDAPVNEMIEGAYAKGLSSICFTDHNDPDFPPCGVSFDLDTDRYYAAVMRAKEAYRDKIDVRFGVEIGLQPHLADQFRAYLKQYPFDYVIGSSHLVNGQDPYEPAFFEGQNEHDAYCAYFQTVLDNLHAFSDFDAYGHLDYVVRYGPRKNSDYTYAAYAEYLEPVLKLLIEKQVGLEINTAGYKYGLHTTNPMPDIIKRYLALGGECVTIGADAHTPAHIAYDFPKAIALLKECGVRYLCSFRNREPFYYPIDALY